LPYIPERCSLTNPEMKIFIIPGTADSTVFTNESLSYFIFYFDVESARSLEINGK